MRYILLILLCAYIVFINAIVGLTMIPPGSVAGKAINEIMQDRIEMLFGIQDLLDIAVHKPLKYVLHDKKDLIADTGQDSYMISGNDFQINQSLGHSFTLSNPGRGFFLEGRAPDVYDPRQGGGNYFMWNTQLDGRVILDFDRSFFNPSIMFRITGPVVLLFFSFLFTLGSLFPTKPFNNLHSAFHINTSYCFPLYLIAFIAWLLFFFLYFPYLRNYETSYHDTYEKLASNRDALKSLLDSTSKISFTKLDCLQDMNFNTPVEKMIDKYFFPSGIQEKNIHNGFVFVSKQPFFPYNYIRVNVDLFNYLFYAPNLTEDDLLKINHQMEYQNLGNGIWLGQYRKYIDAVTEIYWAYAISILLWSIMIFISIFKYKNLYEKHRFS